MNFRIALGTALLVGLAGCVEDTGSSGSGSSGTPSQVDSMVGPCISQAARMTGVPTGAVVITQRLETGGGPLVTLEAAGVPYSCRRESDGSVTVFSEYAN